jgi:hypothetical protein
MSANRRRSRRPRDPSRNVTRDVFGYLSRVIVLPCNNYGPTSASETLLRVSIAGTVGLQLRSPPSAIARRQRSMLWTPMPPTCPAVDREFCARENDIHRSPRRSRHNPLLEAISQAAPMKLPTHVQFQRGVASPLFSHRCALPWVRLLWSPGHGVSSSVPSRPESRRVQFHQ